MHDISTRINALITYLFLGPIILLAKKDTPLAHTFVRGHALRSSIYMLIGIICIGIYFVIKPLLDFSLFFVRGDTLVLMSMISILLIALCSGAYRAYRGVSASSLGFGLSFSLIQEQQGKYTEEEKIRIIVSFLPFLGIYIAQKYPLPEILVGRKVGNILTFLLIISSIFMDGYHSTLVFLIMSIYIGIVVMTSIRLFEFDIFTKFSLYDRLPSYTEFDAHIRTSMILFFDILRVAFGSEKTKTYHDEYEHQISLVRTEQKAESPYFLPIGVSAVPFVNLITLPSLWQSRYREYHRYIIQGLIITLLALLSIWWYGLQSVLGLLLVFPILHLLVSTDNIMTRAPGVSFVIDMVDICSRGREKIRTFQTKKEVKFQFGEEKDIQK